MMQNRTNKTRLAIPIVALALVIGAAGCGGGSSPSSSAGGTTASGAGQVLPVTENPIKNTSTAPGLAITKVLVENNVSAATGKPAEDHLEILLENTSSKPLDQFEVYYKFTDPTAGVSEGYYSKLDGFSIDPGAGRAVHFDNTGEPDHYPENAYSLYHTAQNALDVEVTVSSPGVKPATSTVQKDDPGAEGGVE